LLQTPPALILRKAQDAAEPVITRQEDTITVSMETLKHGGDLSKRLYEYLQSCPEYWQEYLLNGLNHGKFPLSRTTEAARRVAQKDIDGAKRILNTSTLAFRESFSEPIEVDSIVGMFCDKPVEGVVSTLKKASFPERIAPSTLSAETTRAAPTVPEPLNLDAPPRRLYMDAGREEIIEEILRLERKHIQEGLSYDRVRYLGDNTLSRRKEFLLDYLYSLCDHLESYQIGIHYLVERQAIQELKRIEEEKAKKRMSAGVQNFAPPITGQGKSRDLAAEKIGVSGRTAEKAAEIKIGYGKFSTPDPRAENTSGRLSKN
jgi:hypothetical protein